MRCVAVCGGDVQNILPSNQSLRTVEIDGLPMTFGLITVGDPIFDKKDPRNARRVLVRVKAFSCNYRDKSLIFGAMQGATGNSFYPLGSEFVGEVIDVGPEVASFKVSDRVMGDNCYLGTQVSENGIRGGIPTNHASKEYQIFQESKLIHVPESMSDRCAACFSIGYQTVYSIIRKLNVEPGANVLVTSAKSNTSIFAIQALKKLNVNVYALTSSGRHRQELQWMGVKELIEVKLEGADINLSTDDVSRHASGLGEVISMMQGFDYVVDPFFDVYLSLALKILKAGGKYATCGLTGLQLDAALPTVTEVFAVSALNNFQLIFNCLGLRQDLEDALNDFKAGMIKVIIDSVHGGSRVDDFFHRTFTATDRFGKVVYEYN